MADDYQDRKDGANWAAGYGGTYNPESPEWQQGAAAERFRQMVDGVGERSRGDTHAGPAQAPTLKGCLAGIAFLIGFPLVAYVLIGGGVVLYEQYERRARTGPSAPAAPPVCTQTAPPCGPNDMYKDVVTGTLHPHPPKDLAEQEAWRRDALERKQREAVASKRARGARPSAKPAVSDR